ncbi:MAG: acetate--CoA ligase [Crocinitomicaceae bacterium]|jgi:acetyl-CoA synthetase|nr:acetate--CoA ligase [Crocinitomicaceae bacterium]
MIPTNFEEYQKAYHASINNPELFWGDFAKREFDWNKPWDNVLSGDMASGNVKWFEGAELNITENCIDRHLAKKGNQTAIIFEANDPKEKALHISYNDLSKNVNKTANMLKSMGAKKGDRICIYMPMVPELAYAVLACARIGAIHSVVFAGFSAKSLSDRINDGTCNILLTADAGFRGTKVTELKSIADEALEVCPTIKKVIVLNRTNTKIDMKLVRDHWWHEEFSKASTDCEAEIMNAEDPLFMLYTSGSTGNPKGMVHTCGGYMVYTNYSFRSVFQYKEGDVYWCTADIGWITGHSYILYAPLTAGATTIMFEGIPSYPNNDRFWEVVAKHKVNIFYTAPTAIRALQMCDSALVEKHDLSSLKTLGTVGEPINIEAWEWYDEKIGKKNCPIVDTWWQTETGGIMISPLTGVTECIPTFATLPLPGIQPCLRDETGKEVIDEGEGRLFMKFPWPSMARTIYGDHQRYMDTYFSAYKGNYFTGDGAKRDAKGNYRITGRVDDVVIVSGHNLGTAEIENALDEHESIVEAAVVGYPHDIKGNSIYAFVTLKDITMVHDEATLNNLRKEVLDLVSKIIGPIAKPEKIQFTTGLPKTRSGKIMRRILRKIASNELDSLGDISTLLNPECVEDIIENRL